MDDKKADISLLILLFIPVVLAVCSLLSEFDIIDLVYLILVGCLVLKYFLTKE